MTKTRYLLSRRMKLQTNRKWKNLTDADFRYHWGDPSEHHIFDEPCDNAFDCFDSLDKVHEILERHADDYPYGYRIFKLEQVEEVKTDKPYQPVDILEPA